MLRTDCVEVVLGVSVVSDGYHTRLDVVMGHCVDPVLSVSCYPLSESWFWFQSRSWEKDGGVKSVCSDRGPSRTPMESRWVGKTTGTVGCQK